MGIPMKPSSILALILLSIFIALAALPDSSHADATVLSDPDEYDAFIKARDTKDMLRKAILMENFVQVYPDSSIKVNALEHALLAYQQAGLLDKVEATAEAILQLEQDNLPVLAELTYILRIKATNGSLEAGQKVQSIGKKGLKALTGWAKPAVMSQEEYERQRAQMTAVFAGGAGFGALQEKDYASARKYYLIAVRSAPDSLADTYQMADACLSLPVPDSTGFWYLARAHHLAEIQKNSVILHNIERNGRARYRKHHGSSDGWEQLLAQAARETTPPGGFSVAAAQSPCEQAVSLIRERDLVLLTFTDWKLILSQRDCSPEATQAADKLWQYIQEKQNRGTTRMVIPAKIVSIAGETLLAAVTRSGRHDNQGELLVKLAAPAGNIPTVYADVDIVGFVTSYTAQPFQIIISQAEIR